MATLRLDWNQRFGCGVLTVGDEPMMTITVVGSLAVRAYSECGWVR